MASSSYDEESCDSNLSQYDSDTSWGSSRRSASDEEDAAERRCRGETASVVHRLAFRQVYGRVQRNPRARTVDLLPYVHRQCKFNLKQIIESPDALSQIYMGFTRCGQYFVSFVERIGGENSPPRVSSLYFPTLEYELYVWRFIPGKKLRYVAKYRIFRQFQQGHLSLRDIMFVQFPTDPYRLICYGSFSTTESEIVFITILTLPMPNNCKYCVNKQSAKITEQGWCLRHGYMVHYCFSLLPRRTTGDAGRRFDPHISMAYPDQLVINTGVAVHILNVSSPGPPPPPAAQPPSAFEGATKYEEKTNPIVVNFADNASEASEASIENFGTTIEAILEDLGEYDLENSAECGRPFHELNISCEPLNVTGKTYHNEKPKVIDKRVAEKAYEFTEETESLKCEKLSSFRKRRLADKKYEFSEDNSENIVPFNSVRRERPFFRTSTDLFLSPRSPGLRSPILSPNSRYRSSPHYSRSPISPRENTRKFYAYSPSLDSDCSDSDSRLILKQQPLGLLITDGSRKDDSPRAIKKIVRRYSSFDFFESSSLVSGQSKDDYNIPIEIPLIVQNLTDVQFEIVPESVADRITETQLITTQRTLDCEQFLQRRAQRFCSERQIQFLYCQDYDVRLLHVCPMSGEIIGQAMIKFSGMRTDVNCSKPESFVMRGAFCWNIETDSFEFFEAPDLPIRGHESSSSLMRWVPVFRRPNCRDVLVMDYLTVDRAKKRLMDYGKRYEISLTKYTVDSDETGPKAMDRMHIRYMEVPSYWHFLG